MPLINPSVYRSLAEAIGAVGDERAQSWVDLGHDRRRKPELGIRKAAKILTELSAPPTNVSLWRHWNSTCMRVKF